MWTILPLTHMARGLANRLAPWPERSLRAAAKRCWQVAPGEVTVSRPAFGLPGQVDRVGGWVFADAHPRRALAGGVRTVHAPTMGFLVEDAVLQDGTLFTRSAREFLHGRGRPRPRLRVTREIERGAIYSTAAGLQYFGQWLMDDCATYRLACAEGPPITTDRPITDHAATYERLFGMAPERVDDVLIRNAVVFEDVGQNRGKRDRFGAMRATLLDGIGARCEPHPGVFVLRGLGGQRRLLRNERELAERLVRTRGFRVVDPGVERVEDIVRACARARVVIGVEGSQLMHGILGLGPGGAIVTLQPPNRFCVVYKDLADRDEQAFGYVVGRAVDEDFVVDPDEVERTLDLIPEPDAFLERLRASRT